MPPASPGRSRAGISACPRPARTGRTSERPRPPSNPTPFEGTLSPTATCGVDVPATLTLATNQGGQTVPVSLPTGAASSPLTHLSGSPALPIPDESSAGVTSTINVRTPGRVKDLDVRIASLIHGYVGDLVIDLTSPEGTTVRLADHPGGPDNSGDHLINTVFDDEATVGISSGAAPYTGSFRPQNDQLSRFDGQQRQGNWTLRVRDLSEGDTGTLTDWQTVTQRAVCNLQDPHAPETSLTGGPSGPTASRTASFGFASSEAGSSFECSLDGAPVVECESPHTLAGLSEGTHTFRVQARDQPGNLDPSPAEHTWRVDATAPAVSLSTPRAGASVRDARPQVAGSGGVAAGDSETVTVKLWRGALAAGAARADADRAARSGERCVVDASRDAGGRRLDRPSRADRRGRQHRRVGPGDLRGRRQRRSGLCDRPRGVGSRRRSRGPAHRAGRLRVCLPGLG